MAYQPIEELLPKSDYSIYKLVRLASKRSLELADGSPKLIDGVSADAKTPTVALDEIRAGKVVLKAVAAEFAPSKTKKAKKEEDADEEIESKA
jgi:DNA-directed RNA polymerase subunit K/omega